MGCAFNVVAQIDTLRQPPVKGELPFHYHVNVFKYNNNLTDIDLQMLFSYVATEVHEYPVEFTLEEIQRIQEGKFVPFLEVQHEIKLMMQNYNRRD